MSKLVREAVSQLQGRGGGGGGVRALTFCERITVWCSFHFVAAPRPLTPNIPPPPVFGTGQPGPSSSSGLTSNYGGKNACSCMHSVTYM